MKIWKIISPNILTTEDRPDNISADTQAKVKVTKVLFSENEVRAYRGIPKPKYPLVPGRFAVGVVAEAGKGCTFAQKNMRVYIRDVLPCGECARCRAGDGIAAECRAMIARREGILRPLEEETGADGKSSRKSLCGRHDVGRDVVLLIGVQRAAAAVPALHFVTDEQNVVLRTPCGELFDESLVERRHAALPLHALDDDRAGILSRGALHIGNVRLRIGDVGNERPEILMEFLLPRRRQREERAPVEAVL